MLWRDRRRPGRGGASVHWCRRAREPLYYGVMFRALTAPTLPLLAAMPAALGVSTAAPGAILAELLLFLLKAGSLTFGSGLVIVPFVEKGLVQQTGWLDERQFLVAVAMGMLSPGPVVITATFVSYLVAGFGVP